jgi:hypothetical protein
MNERFKQSRKEVIEMQEEYEAPELTQIGQADEVVMGAGFDGDDWPLQSALDFEFEED